MGSTPELNISLEPHLIDKLLPLTSLLPPALSEPLHHHLTNTTPTIPYSLLASISQWSRSQSGQAALQSNTPLLHANAYTMVTLLAGTVTSPERQFPAHIPKTVLAEEERKRQVTDKKAVVSLVNALLSIAGSGAATWLAAERWRNEWRVLLSFIVAVVVAVSETILYIIWQSRRSGKLKRQQRRIIASRYKKNDGDEKIPEGTNNSDMTRPDLLTQRDGHAIRLRLPGISQEEF